MGIFLLFFEKVQSPVGHGSGGIRFRFRKEYLTQTDVVFIVFGTVFPSFIPCSAIVLAIGERKETESSSARRRFSDNVSVVCLSFLPCEHEVVIAATTVNISSSAINNAV